MAKSHAAKSDMAIELPRISIGMMEVTIIGDTPLVVHQWSEKAKRQMLDKQLKKARTVKEAKDPVADFEASMYRLGDGAYGFPSIGFKNAAVTAVTSIPGMTKVAARQAFHVIGEGVDVTGAFDGTVMRQNLVRVLGGAPRMREDLVRVGMGTADLRYRAEFWPWHARLLLRYNSGAISTEQCLNVLNVAGFAVGIGEWRPERNGEFGMFHVATEGELKTLGRGGVT